MTVLVLASFLRHTRGLRCNLQRHSDGPDVRHLFWQCWQTFSNESEKVMIDSTQKAIGFSEFRRGWPVVVASMFGIGLGLSPVPFYTIGMLAPELNKAFGWTFGEIMTGLMIMTLAVLVASTVVGYLGDRFGVRRVALISLVLFALSFMAFSMSNGSIVLFYINWAAMALLGAGTLPVTAAPTTVTTNRNAVSTPRSPIEA